MANFRQAMSKHTFIYLVKSDIIIAENNVQSKDHHHHAIKIILQLRNKSSLLFNGNIVEHNTIIFNADRIHSLDSQSNPVLIFLINPESELGSHIRSGFLVNNDVFFTNIKYSQHLINHFNEFVSKQQSINEVLHIYDEIITAVCGDPADSFVIDERIRRIFMEINNLEDKKAPVKDLASLAYLSESRFMHLFKEEVKIPVRQYLSWLRLLDALKLIIGGKTFTEAAMDSGFTDLPHLHKTFTHYFGAKIQDYFNNSRFIQVWDFSDV